MVVAIDSMRRAVLIRSVLVVVRAHLLPECIAPRGKVLEGWELGHQNREVQQFIPSQNPRARANVCAD